MRLASENAVAVLRREKKEDKKKWGKRPTLKCGSIKKTE